MDIIKCISDLYGFRHSDIMEAGVFGHVRYHCIYIVRVASLVDATRRFEGVGDSVN